MGANDKPRTEYAKPIMSTDLEADLSEEQLREQAAEMPAHFFLGEPLKPFSMGRQLACERVLGRALSKERETALIMVYVCTLEPQQYEQTRTLAAIERFHQAMHEWAESKGITIRNHAGKEAMRISDLLWDELDASDSVPHLKPDQKSKEPPDPLPSGRGGSRATSRASRPQSKGR